jgi:hypothetical protein
MSNWAEVLGDLIAFLFSFNHNETLVRDEVELGAEVLEDLIDHLVLFNHNETIASDDVEQSGE